MDLGLGGKVALVTGASRGIGKAIAAGLAAEGCRVVICAREARALEAAAAEIEAAVGAAPVAPGGAPAAPLPPAGTPAPPAVLPVPADVTSPDDCARLVRVAETFHGRVDILVHNAGGSRGAGPFLDSSEEVFRAALELNTLAGLRLARLTVPLMRRQGGGAILFVASIWGREAGGAPAYNLAKAAEISLAKSLARELAPHNIRVNSVAPGSVLHPGGSWDRRRQADPEGIARFVAAELPFGRFGRPEEIADVVVFLASERASWVSGACLNVDGCQSRSLI